MRSAAIAALALLANLVLWACGTFSDDVSPVLPAEDAGPSSPTAPEDARPRPDAPVDAPVDASVDASCGLFVEGFDTVGWTVNYALLAGPEGLLTWDADGGVEGGALKHDFAKLPEGGTRSASRDVPVLSACSGAVEVDFAIRFTSAYRRFGAIFSLQTGAVGGPLRTTLSFGLTEERNVYLLEQVTASLDGGPPPAPTRFATLSPALGEGRWERVRLIADFALRRASLVFPERSGLSVELAMVGVGGSARVTFGALSVVGGDGGAYWIDDVALRTR